MPSSSFVVHLVGCEDPIPFKHYRTRADAVDCGQRRVQSGDTELANIYIVADASDTGAAIAAFKMGKASYVQCCSRHASEAEIDASNEQAWEAARRGGPQALLKFLGFKDPSPGPNIIRRRV
jgi:hypothetical protein